MLLCEDANFLARVRCCPTSVTQSCVPATRFNSRRTRPGLIPQIRMLSFALRLAPRHSVQALTLMYHWLSGLAINARALHWLVESAFLSTAARNIPQHTQEASITAPSPRQW